MDPFRVPQFVGRFSPRLSLESSEIAGAGAVGGNPRPVMFRSPSAHSAPLGYLSRQLGLAAMPLKPSAWVAWVKFWGKVMATRNSRARKPVEVGRNYPIIYGVSYMSGGADLFHQQYFSCSI